jgi:hypothetical protein
LANNDVYNYRLLCYPIVQLGKTNMNSAETGPRPQEFMRAPDSPEVVAAAEQLKASASQILDWCLAHPDSLPNGVDLGTGNNGLEKEGLETVSIETHGPHPEVGGGHIIIFRDPVEAAVGLVRNDPNDAPFKIARTWQSERVDAHRTVTTLFTHDGHTRTNTSHEKEISPIPGAYMYKPLEPYSGAPATTEGLNNEHIALQVAAELSGLPPEAYKRQDL